MAEPTQVPLQFVCMPRYSMNFSCLFIFPIRIFRVLQVPKRAPAAHHGCRGKVVIGWRRTGGPLERPRVPGIISGRFTLPKRPKKIDDEHKNTCGLKECADGDDQVPGFPSAARLVGINPAWHSQEAGDMHEIKREVEPDYE